MEKMVNKNGGNGEQGWRIWRSRVEKMVSKGGENGEQGWRKW